MLSEYFGELEETRAEKYVKPVLESLPHVVIHELAHAYVNEKILRSMQLPKNVHVFVDEVLARLIERKISSRLKSSGYKWVLVETLEEQFEELKHYSVLKDVNFTLEDYVKLYNEFEKSASSKQLEDFVDKLIHVAQKLYAESFDRSQAVS